ncbi:MAG: ABC transporter permease [Solobacterium sp.]|nr:ABC transporter permease [Solobacterium sp.]
MRKYILTRILKSILSLFAVVSIIIVMIYTMIPRTKIFDNDAGIKKMKGDTRTIYVYRKYAELGYLEYLRKQDMCLEVFGDGEDYTACLVNESAQQHEAIDFYINKGYALETLKSGDPLVYHDYNWLELLGKFYGRLFRFDSKNAIQDEGNPDLERKYYWGKNPDNGTPAFMCSGCEYKYQLYFNGKFPFIHQHFLTFDFGESYPTSVGIPTTQVINEGQGAIKNSDQTFPTGLEQESALIQTSCKYKVTPDHLDEKKFDDHYADCLSAHESPSMVSTSYIMGIIALIISYGFGIPFGISMAQHKDKFRDKLGIAYINILVAVPSLAFIFFMRSIGTLLGMPDKFPQLGFDDIRSWIMPIVILALLNMPSLMMWLRRYMIDQVNADYVKFARAKGLSEKEIFRKHILRNAIIPIVNGIPSSIILCISGALITESAFAVPGMGKMLPNAISQMNNNMVLTLTMIFTALSIFAVLLGDLLMILVDPRISLTSKGGE